jgi:hypothetical protein
MTQYASVGATPAYLSCLVDLRHILVGSQVGSLVGHFSLQVLNSFEDFCHKNVINCASVLSANIEVKGRLI